MENLKTYLVEVFLKKILPSLIKTCLMALIAYIAAHQNLLGSLGVTYDTQGHTIDIDLDTLSAWALVVIPGAITALFTTIQHHGAAVIEGAPQSGDLRQNPVQPVVGGERKTDPVKEKS